MKLNFAKLLISSIVLVMAFPVGAQPSGGVSEAWIAPRQARPVRIELRPEVTVQGNDEAVVRLRQMVRISAADDLRLGDAADAVVVTLLPTDRRATIDADTVRRALFNYGWENHQLVIDGSKSAVISRVPSQPKPQSAAGRDEQASSSDGGWQARKQLAQLGVPDGNSDFASSSRRAVQAGYAAAAPTWPERVEMAETEMGRTEMTGGVPSMAFKPVIAQKPRPKAVLDLSSPNAAPRRPIIAPAGNEFDATVSSARSLPSQDDPADAAATVMTLGPASPASEDTSPEVAADDGSSAQVAEMTPTAAAADAPEKLQTLREILTMQALSAVGMSPTQGLVHWQESDARFLAMRGIEGETFDIKPIRMRGLGQVSWEVVIRAPGTKARKLTVAGVLKAWQNQVVAVRPLAQGAIITAQEVNVRRQLVDQLQQELELSRESVVGMQASRDIDVGATISARMLQQVPLAKTGQPISVQVSNGAIRVQQTLRAMEGGGLGQTIRAKNDETRQTFSVRLTGPQQGVLADIPPEVEVSR